MTTPAEGAAEAATEVVQAAAKPLAFFAILGAGALAVAVLVRRFGASLPLPGYLVDFVGGDDDEEETESDDD